MNRIRIESKPDNDIQSIFNINLVLFQIDIKILDKLLIPGGLFPFHFATILDQFFHFRKQWMGLMSSIILLFSQNELDSLCWWSYWNFNKLSVRTSVIAVLSWRFTILLLATKLWGLKSHLYKTDDIYEASKYYIWTNKTNFCGTGDKKINVIII